MSDPTTDTPRTRKPRQASMDQEAKAITACWQALVALADDPARERVIDYVRGRLGLTAKEP